MSYTVNLNNFSDQELTDLLLACLLLLAFLSWKITKQMKGTDLFSFLFPAKNLSKEEKLFYKTSLKEAIPATVLSLLGTILIYFLIILIKKRLSE